MVSERAQVGGLIAYLVGLAVISVAILQESELWLRVGGACLFASLLFFGWNAAKVFSHFRKPQIKPLSAATAYEPATGRARHSARAVLDSSERGGQRTARPTNL
jgi:hypothetical protein